MRYISIGHDCSTASALRTLNLRSYALPFDWVRTKGTSLYQCIAEDFAKFHMNLKLSPDKRAVLDAYGIEYLHDYPVDPKTENKLPCGNITFEMAEGWADSIETVRAKYARRIERFREVFLDKSPIVVLYRGNSIFAMQLKFLLEKTYHHENLVFVVANRSKQVPTDGVFVCNPDANGWNDTNIWKTAIGKAEEWIQAKQSGRMPVGRRRWALF